MAEMPEPFRFDLARFSEAARRRLYDRMAEIAFAEIRHTPDEAGLQIVHIAGRWFAVWTDLDEPPTLPDHLRVRLVRIDVNPDQPADIALYDV